MHSSNPCARYTRKLIMRRIERKIKHIFLVTNVAERPRQKWDATELLGKSEYILQNKDN